MSNQQSLINILRFLADEQVEVRVDWEGQERVHKKEHDHEVWEILCRPTVGKIACVAKDYIWLNCTNYPEIIPLKRIRRIQVHGTTDLIDKFKESNANSIDFRVC